MFSILLLGLGLVAVAGLFPAAGSIQQKTVDDVMAEQVQRSAFATLEARGITFAMLPPPAANGTLASSPAFNAAYSLADRSFPSTKLPANRDYYWTVWFRKDPLQTDLATGWQAYIMVLKRLDGQFLGTGTNEAGDASVTRQAGLGAAGDFILDDVTEPPRVYTRTLTEDGQVSGPVHAVVPGTLKQVGVHSFIPTP